jgi:putative membrane protein
MNFIMKVLINTGAFYMAVYVLQPHIVMQNEAWYAYLALAFIFGLVNSLIRPAVMFLSCPLVVLTLGLGTLLINAAMFLFAGWLARQIGIGFSIPDNKFMYAILGSVIISVVSFVANRLFRAQKRS